MFKEQPSTWLEWSEGGTFGAEFTEVGVGGSLRASVRRGTASEDTVLTCSPEPAWGTGEEPSDSTAKDTGLLCPLRQLLGLLSSLLVHLSTWNNPCLYPHTAYHSLNKGAKPGHRPFFPCVLFSFSAGGDLSPRRHCGCLETFLAGTKGWGGGLLLASNE